MREQDRLWVRVALVVCVVSSVNTAGWARLTGEVGAWDIHEAELRFRIELDPNQPQLPDVFLSEIKASKGPSAQRSARKRSDFSGTYYRVDGRTYKHAFAVSSPATVAYECRPEYQRFAALVGLLERADPDMVVSFEVHADKRMLYSSGPVTRTMRPAGVSVAIPGRAKEIRLVTSGDLKGHRRACWIQGGFVLRGKSPDVGHAELFTAGRDPAEFEVAVVTANGERRDSRVLWTDPHGPIGVQFDCSDGWSVYHAYLIPKGKATGAPSGWQPQAGLLLETRHSPGNDRDCEDLSGFEGLWTTGAESMGRSFVQAIHHGYPVHVGSDGQIPANGLSLYRYTGYFQVEKAGQYTFASASNWGSYILVDDNAVVRWPGRHDYRAGIKGQKHGKIALQPGVHKIEYLNYEPPDRLLTIGAWTVPGGKPAIMTSGDFLPVRFFHATTAEHVQGTGATGSFEWRTIDDWRTGTEPTQFVQMQLRALGASSGEAVSYEWLLDDGTSRRGSTVNHVFLNTGRRDVTLRVVKDGKTLGQLKQQVPVTPEVEKIWVEPRRPEAFRAALSSLQPDRLPVGDLVSLYVFADRVEDDSLGQRAADALITRTGELVAHAEHHDFCLRLAEQLASAGQRKYDAALRICRLLGAQAKADSRTRYGASVIEARLLLDCFGQAEQAVQILERLQRSKLPSGVSAEQLQTTHAEALLALGQTESATEKLRALADEITPSDQLKRSIKHAGWLRHAQQLVLTDDEVQLDHAMDLVRQIFAEDPLRLFSPGVNIVRLDIHLARRENEIALAVAERVSRLDLSQHDHAEMLLRHVRALCALGRIEPAKEVYAALVERYPNASAAETARNVIVSAATASRP